LSDNELPNEGERDREKYSGKLSSENNKFVNANETCLRNCFDLQVLFAFWRTKRERENNFKFLINNTCFDRSELKDFYTYSMLLMAEKKLTAFC
jgi:hypothetical protein